MKPLHSLLILLVPALLCGLSVFFLQRADRKYDHQMETFQEISRALDSSTGAARSALSERQNNLWSTVHATRSSKSFWVVACVFASFFLVLALAFLFYEARHRRRRDQIIASFVAEDAPSEGTQ